MATRLGIRGARLTAVRALRTVKGRREQQRFAFEGATLLAEALAAGFPVAELYLTQAAYDSTPLVRELEAAGTTSYILAESAAAGISDLRTPTGIIAVGAIGTSAATDVVRRGSPIMILADVSDPANAGTLLRSADAFGCPGVIFGRLGVDPYHPKVVRGSMGAIFRLALAVASPSETAKALADAGLRVLGLAAGGRPLAQERWERRIALIVGHERQGLGAWEALCERLLGIQMTGPAESLSAAVAGSIALYEATRNRL